MVIRTTGMCHRYTDRQVSAATGNTDGSLEGARGMVFELAGNHHDGGEIPWGSKDMVLKTSGRCRDSTLLPMMWLGLNQVPA